MLLNYMIIDNLNNLRNTKKVNILIRSQTRMITYFTIWVFILQLLYYSNIVKTYQFSILILSLLVYIGGFIIVYIHPRYLYIENLDLTLTGRFLRIFDVFFHHLPIAIYLYNYDNSIKADSGYFCLFIILIYVLIINPFKKYSFK